MKINPLYVAVALPFILLSGCANIQPWERENIAKEHMELVSNDLLFEFENHANFSREGTNGGYGLSGGGCGCN